MEKKIIKKAGLTVAELCEQLVKEVGDAHIKVGMISIEFVEGFEGHDGINSCMGDTMALPVYLEYLKRYQITRMQHDVIDSFMDDLCDEDEDADEDDKVPQGVA